MKIYKTMIRPVVTYSSETWTLTAKDENNLRIFERQILRKIFGPVNTLRTGSFKMFKRPFPGFLTILTL